jgi:sec-independent protein translocase protein TatB
MFSSMELMLIVLVTLLVIGPERLPETLRTLGLWVGRLSRSFTAMKVEIEQEIGMDDVRRQLHNESVMAQMIQMEDEIKNSIEAPVMQEPPITPAAAGAAQELAEEDANAKKVAEKTASSTQTESPETAITGGDAEHHAPKTSS